MLPSERVAEICAELGMPCRPAVEVPESDWERWLEHFDHPGPRPEPRTCARCGAAMRLRSGRYGKLWGCSNYPECDYTEDADD
jgi:hypothetical protein